jgi:hypothetical protein
VETFPLGLGQREQCEENSSKEEETRQLRPWERFVGKEPKVGKALRGDSQREETRGCEAEEWSKVSGRAFCRPSSAWHSRPSTLLEVAENP